MLLSCARSIAVNYLEENFVLDPGFGISFVYFDHGQDFDPDDILRSILKHMIQRKGVVPPKVQDLYSKYEMKDLTSPSHEESVEALKAGLHEFTNFFVVIDGLDESSERTREKLLKDLQQLQQLYPQLRLMVTGRPFVKDIPCLFSDCGTIDIIAENDDVVAFVHGQIEEDKFLRNKALPGTELRKLIVDTIVEKAEGM